MSTPPQGPPAPLPPAPPLTDGPPSAPPAPPSAPPSTEAPRSAPSAPFSAPEEAPLVGINNVQVASVLGQARVSLPLQSGPSTSAAAANSRRLFHPHGHQNPANNDPISQTGEAPPGQELPGVTVQRLDWPSPTVAYVVPLWRGQDIAQDLHDFTHQAQGFRRGVSFSVVAANGLVRDPSLITPERTHTFPGLYVIAGLQGIILPRYDESDRLIDVVSFLTISLSNDGALIGGCLDINPHRPLQSAGRGFIILSMLHENVSRLLVQLIATSVAAASSDDEEEED